MRRLLRTNRIWQIIYPLAVYFIYYNVVYLIVRMILTAAYSDLFCLMIASLATIPAIWIIYRRLPIVRGQHPVDAREWVTEITGIAVVTAIGIALNFLVSNTPLSEISSGYARASQQLYSGGLFTKIITNTVLVPILEETLFRGIIAGQLDQWYGRRTAIIISALLFGVMHFNVIQFTYAAIVGIFMAYVYLRHRYLPTVIIAHGLTNLIVIIAVAG